MKLVDGFDSGGFRGHLFVLFSGGFLGILDIFRLLSVLSGDGRRVDAEIAAFVDVGQRVGVGLNRAEHGLVHRAILGANGAVKRAISAFIVGRRANVAFDAFDERDRRFVRSVASGRRNEKAFAGRRRENFFLRKLCKIKAFHRSLRPFVLLRGAFAVLPKTARTPPRS